MASSAGKPSRSYAIIVAADRYADPGLEELRSPSRDAEEFAQVLEDPDIGGFEVQALVNQPGPLLLEEIEGFFADRRADDLLVLYLSCHGVKNPAGQLYFASSTTKLGRLAATGISADFLYEQVDRCRARKVLLLLDCCYSGAYLKGRRPKGRSRAGIGPLAGRGRAVITSSTALQYSFEMDTGQVHGVAAPSVFTAALVEGLRTGEADRDRDGLVSVDDLYGYVFEKVREVTPDQTPEKKWGEVSGDFIIARNPHPPARPREPLPPELVNDLRNSNPGTREMAILSLTRLAFGPDPGLALSARETLEVLAADDNPKISTAAMAALSHVPLLDDSPQEPASAPSSGSQVHAADPHRRAEAGQGSSLASDAVAAPDPTEGSSPDAAIPGPDGYVGYGAGNASLLTDEGRPRPWLGRRRVLSCVAGAAAAGVITVAGLELRHPAHRSAPVPDLRRAAPPRAGSMIWRFATGAGVGSRPAVSGDAVYFGSDDHNLYAVDVRSGSKLWSFRTGGVVASSPAVAGGVVYVGSADRSVYAIDAQSGDKLWGFPTGGPVESSPAVVDGVIYLGSQDQNVYALSADDGTLLWKVPTGGLVNSSPAVSDGIIYIGSGDGTVYALSIGGMILSSFTMGGFVDSSPAVTSGVVYAASSDGRVVALSSADLGKVIWSHDAGPVQFSSPAVAGNAVFLGSDDQDIYALSADQGTKLWSSPTGGPVDSSPAILAEIVYVGSNDGNLYALSAGSGKRLWSFRTEGHVFSSPALANRVAYVGSDDSHLYAIRI